ncbi:MAG TPA: class I SAM-dependent methyltransferase [Thermoleophilaceae bacterium]|nr:class I SAM-dependent methyltransferase [Thermoleophilaceae bacterium]
MAIEPCPYDQIYSGYAPYYDDFMDYPAYAGWVRRLEALSLEVRPRGRFAFDAGCGTGKSTEPLLELGYQVTGCDSCPQMLARARAKLGGRARLVRADLVRLPRLGSFDYVSCLNDVVNYLLHPDELEAALRALRANLSSRGVLVFDTSTQALYRTIYARERRRDLGHASLLWRGRTPTDFRPGGLASATVEVVNGGGPGRARRLSRHVQRHYTEAEVGRALERAGLRLVAVYGQHDDGQLAQPLDEDDHTKAVHVVTRLQ